VGCGITPLSRYARVLSVQQYVLLHTLDNVNALGVDFVLMDRVSTHTSCTSPSTCYD
jgi:hypothetical protein